MALALLELLELDQSHARFKIDIGTNRYFQLKVGSATRSSHGLDWVDDISYTSPVAPSTAPAGLLESSQTVTLPAARFNQGNAYVQLFSFKTPAGRSPGFSTVIEVPRGLHVPLGALPRGGPIRAQSMSLPTYPAFAPPRRVPCRSVAESWSTTASLDDLLSALVKAALPAVIKMLGGGTNGGGAGNGSGSANLLTALLGTVLGGRGSGLAVSATQSLTGDAPVAGNRFVNGAVSQQQEFSKPFIFGIDDAILGTLIGPILQVLPQLVNSANQQRVQLKQEDNKLISGILAEVDKRLQLQQVLDAQRPRTAPAGQPGPSDVDVAAFAKLLQQAGVLPATSPDISAPPAPAAPLPPASVAKSLSDTPTSPALSRHAVVSFVSAGPLAWNGTPSLLFAKGQPLQFRVQLNVGEPAPKSPLPKAILKLTFKDKDTQAVLFEKTFKLKNLSANTPIKLDVTAQELGPVPVQKSVVTLTEFRWLSPKSGKEYKAVGSEEIILVNKYFLTDIHPKSSGVEKELTDMAKFRPFWNKIWEAPVLDAATADQDGLRQSLWELDVNIRYSVVFIPGQPSNGMMETKVLKGQSEFAGISKKTDGRLKAGVELSVAETNKLLPLWEGPPALTPEQLEAFRTAEFAGGNGGEFIDHLKLKGSAGQRGMVWVVPIFTLGDFAAKSVQKTDEFGQITATGDETLRFPVPIACRSLGVKSKN